MSRWVHSVERHVAAAPEVLYALVSDPDRHAGLDGSGSVVGVMETSTQHRPLGVGDHFTMAMDLRGRYAMTSTVIEAVPGRRFAWQSRPHKDSARWRLLFGGRIWAYAFEPEGDGTHITETWDLREEPLRWLVIAGRSQARTSMLQTLDRMAAIVERGDRPT